MGDPMATRINITSKGRPVVRVTFDTAARTLKYETGMTDGGTTRAISDAIERAVMPSDRTRARVEMAQLRAHHAPVDAFVRELMRVVLDLTASFESAQALEDFDIELGEWLVAPDGISSPPTKLLS
jgi:hypothetical protein